jgi:hypothetical protein
MEHFLLFAGHDGICAGGWHEHRGQFEDKVIAGEHGKNLCIGALAYDWWHVVDTLTGEITEQGTAN